MKNIKTGEERKGTLNDDETKAFDERGNEFDYKYWLPSAPSPGFLVSVFFGFIGLVVLTVFAIIGSRG